MSDFKNASTATHALHSRLQLIRGKLYCRKGFTIQEFVDANREFFMAATNSIIHQHQIDVLESNWRTAAQMFLYSVNDAPGGL